MWLIVLVEGDARGHDGACKGNGFGEEEYGHDGDGADGHDGTEGGGLMIYIWYLCIDFNVVLMGL